MGHEMHMLEGFILDSTPYGESGRILKILTREFGIMSVSAIGVRELKSKMRGSMDILQLVTFEYVEGKEVKRLTGIHEKQKFENIFTIKKRRVISNVVNFILRSVVGETQNEKLWESFLEGFRLLDSANGESTNPSFLKRGRGDFVVKDFNSLEIIWLIKILVSLGYWEEGKLDAFSDENFAHLSLQENKKEVIEEINKSIQSTHL